MSAHRDDERSDKVQLVLATSVTDDNAEESAPASSAGPRQRPRKIIELDGVPRSRWRIEPEATYLWKGRLWRKEPVGCVLCVEHDDDDHLTFASAESRWSSTFVCMQHGELHEVAYEMKKVYQVTIGSVVRQGEERVNDTILFPSEMTLGEQTALIERLLDEAQQEEVDSGAAPTD